MQDMGNDPNRETAACGHPALEQHDETQKAEAGDGYATRHDPFVYFHSVIDEPTYCDAHVVALGSPVGRDAGGGAEGRDGPRDRPQASRTHARRFSFITPNLCEDGHDFPCTNQTGGASALADIDGFLETWVPKIEALARPTRRAACSRSPSTSPTAPNRTPPRAAERNPGPGSPLPGISGPGGGRVGAVLISPFIEPGTVVQRPPTTTTPRSASWEQLFGLPDAGRRGERAALRPGRVHGGEIDAGRRPLASCAVRPAHAPVGVGRMRPTRGPRMRGPSGRRMRRPGRRRRPLRF